MKTNCQSSGTCLEPMKLCLAIVVCVSAIGYRSVQAVNCTTGSKTDCVKSDFTSDACEAGLCSCNDKVNFLPIPTGCAAKPQVTYAPGRTLEFLVNLSPHPWLICLTIDTGATISWEKDGTVIDGATLLNYTFPDSTAERAGSYVCATTVGSEKIKSNPVNIKAVTTAAGPSAPPVVDGIPTSVAIGATITPLCTGIPFGATYQFQLTKNSPTSENTVIHDMTNGNISCKITNMANTANTTSALKPWPTTNAEDITNATVTITTAAATSSSAATQYFKTGTTVNATCVTTPESQFVLNGTTIAYVFTDSANPAAEYTANTYPIQPTSGTHTIRCDAKYGDKGNNRTSNPVTVIFNETYVAVPDLTSNPKPAVVPLGSPLVLTCGDDKKAQGVTYTWTKGGIVIPRQRDRIIQYSKFTQADAGKYACTANLPTFAAESIPVDVKAAANSLHVLGSTLLLALVALASSKIL